MAGRVHREWHPLQERWVLCPGRWGAEQGDRGVQVSLSEVVHTARSQVCSSVLCTRPPEPLERYQGRNVLQ